MSVSTPAPSHVAPGPLSKPDAAFTRKRQGRRAKLALAGLLFSLLLALSAVALARGGNVGPAIAAAVAALILTLFEATMIARYLTRWTVFRRWNSGVEYELTREGGVYLLIVGLIALASVNTGNNLLFMILAILLAGMLASGVLSKAVLARLKLDLVLPSHVFAGERVRAHLIITNLKRVIPTYSLTVETSAGADAGIAAHDSRILTRSVYTVYIPPRQSVKESVELRFPQRGRYTQNCFQVSSKFPFGILRRRRGLDAGREVLVLPPVSMTSDFAATLTALGGSLESRSKGGSSDLYALRDYQPGDSARAVDWKSTAKTQRLTVREHTREEENRVTILFDARIADMSAATLARFERSVTLCACLAWQACEEGASLQFAGGRLRTRLAPAGEIIYAILEELAVIEATVAGSPLQSEPSPSLGGNLTNANSIAIVQDSANRERFRGCTRVIAMDELVS